MTAIAGFKIHTVPILIGDILLSTEGDVGFSVKLPGSGQNSTEFAEERSITYYPAKLGQKVTIINKHLMIATAGSLNVAKDFVEFLKADAKVNNEPSWEYLNEFVTTFSYDDDDEFAFILYYYNIEENVSAMTGHNVEPVELDGYEGLLVAGSGSDELINALSNIDITFENDKVGNGVKGSLAVNGIISRLWSLDVTSQKNIEQAFGGGYEIGTLFKDSEREELGKVGDLLFLELYIKGTPEGILIGINTRIAKFDYLNDDFVIRVMQLMPEKNKSIEEFNKIMHIPRVENRGFIILPIDYLGEYVIDEDALRELPDFNAEHTNIHLQVDAENGQHLSAVFSQWRPKRNSPVEFDGNSFFITPKLWGEILSTADEFLRSNTKYVK